LGQESGMQRLVSQYGFDFQLVREHPEFPIGVAFRRNVNKNKIRQNDEAILQSRLK
jgi:hypothetical protein